MHFYQVRPFSPKVYTRLLGTQTDYIEIMESTKNEFFVKIEEAIETMLAKSMSLIQSIYNWHVSRNINFYITDKKNLSVIFLGANIKNY